MVKIIIIGAGISGLSTYLFLRKHLLLNNASSHKFEVNIYEAYDIHQSSFNATLSGAINGEQANALPANDTDPVFTPQAIGSAIGISKNGLSVLSRLDENASGKSTSGNDGSASIVQQMATHGHSIQRWEIGTARGFKIVDVNLASREDGKSESGPDSAKPENQAAIKRRNLYHAIMISRQACWEILRDRVLAVAPDAVVRKKVVNVTIGGEKARNIVKFEDGTREEADLVIGADGLRSVLRKAMFQDDGTSAPPNQGQPTPTAKKTWTQSVVSFLPYSRGKGAKAKKPDYVSPHYEGLVGVGGFVPSSVLEATGQKPGSMSIVFGPNGFFGYGYLTSRPGASPLSSPGSSEEAPTTSAPGPLAGWWSTFSSPAPYPYSTTEPPTAQGFMKHLALASLLTRHKSWKNPSIGAILSFVKHDTETHGMNGKGLDASYPTWTTPELPFWQMNGRVVLVGDAAHALQPSSGQGACQALEDAEALSLFLRHFLIEPSSEPPSATTPLLSSSPDRSSLPHLPLENALTAYHLFRTPRVHKIHLRSQKMSNMKSDMNVVMEYTVYFIIWMMTLRWLNWVLNRLGVSDLERYNEELFGYDLPREVERSLKEEEETSKGGKQR